MPKELLTVRAPQKNDEVSPASSGRRVNDILGTGEMADLTRAFDWSQTPVGAVEQWPEALLITVNTLLGSRHPMFLWWGEESFSSTTTGIAPVFERTSIRRLSVRGEESAGRRYGQSSGRRSRQ